MFTWSTEGEYEYNDYAMIVVYDSAKGRMYYQPALATRASGAGTFKLPYESGLGLEVEVYLAFTSDDRKQRSNSMYLGKLTVI